MITDILRYNSITSDYSYCSNRFYILEKNIDTEITNSLKRYIFSPTIFFKFTAISVLGRNIHEIEHHKLLINQLAETPCIQ